MEKIFPGIPRRPTTPIRKAVKGNTVYDSDESRDVRKEVDQQED